MSSILRRIERPQAPEAAEALVHEAQTRCLAGELKYESLVTHAGPDFRAAFTRLSGAHMRRPTYNGHPKAERIARRVAQLNRRS